MTRQSNNPTSAYFSKGKKKKKTLIQKDICTPKFNAALFTIAKMRKQSKCLSINEWIKKM